MTNDRDWRGSNEKVRKKRLKASAQVSSGNLVNVAEALSPEERQAIAEVCLEDFESDRQSHSEWEVMHANWVSVYNQTDAPANPPWQGSSDESLGLLTEACNSFKYIEVDHNRTRRHSSNGYISPEAFEAGKVA